MKTYQIIALHLVLLSALGIPSYATDLSILGDQDYPNGTIISSNPTWTTAQAGEPAPFSVIHVAPATIVYTHTGLDTGREGFLTISLWDLDAEFSGNQVSAFTLDGIAQTVGAFEVGGTDLRVKEFTFLVDASYLTDGELTVSLTFSGPPSGNEVGIDFSKLEIPPTPNCVEPPEGVIAWWTGNGDGAPRVGSYTAVPGNGAQYALGRVAQSFQFDGVNDYVDIGTLGALPTYTVALWVNADVVDTNRTFISQDREGTNDDFMLGIEPEGHFYTTDFNRITVVFQDYPSFNRYKIRDTSDAVPNRWYFVAVTYDGSTMRLWVDGVQKGSVSVGGLAISDQQWNLGQNPHYFPSGVYRNFAGRIDEPMIASRAFTASEIEAIFEAGPAGMCIDTTAPEISPTVTGTLSIDGWYTSDVSVSWTVTDLESEISASTGCETVDVASDTAGLTISCSATSAGGTSTQSVTVNRDATTPTILINSPTAGNYILNQVSTVNFSCSDSLSGIASCLGSISNGGALDTSSVFPKSVTVTATDNAGNTSSTIVNYTVGYAVQALYDQTRAHRSGSTIPIKIRLVDASGANMSSPSVLPHVISVIQISSQASTEFGDAGNSNSDSDFRYDAALGGYIFNLQTHGFQTGSYELNFMAGNPQLVYTVGFQVRQ